MPKFQTRNADRTDLRQLDLALLYLNRSSFAARILDQAQKKGVVISIIHDGRDQYDDVNTVYWDPNSALAVEDDAKRIVGIQSAALGLFHEMAHAVDEDLFQRQQDKKAGAYDDAEERYAVRIEDIVAADLDETPRFNHRGRTVPVLNTTQHTIMEDGRYKWSQMEPDGTIVTGGVYQFGSLPATAPVLATPSTPKRYSDAADDRLRALYGEFLRREGGINTLYHLAGFGSGLGSVAGEELDSFFQALNAYVDRNPDLKRSLLGTGVAIVGDDFKKTILLSFLASAEGQAWAAGAVSGARRTGVSGEVLRALSRSAIGRQILSSPEMSTLLAEIGKRPDAMEALVALLSTGTPAAPSEGRGTIPSGAVDSRMEPAALRAMLLRYLPENSSEAGAAGSADLAGPSLNGFDITSPYNFRMAAPGPWPGGDNSLGRLLGLAADSHGIDLTDINGESGSQSGRVRLFGTSDDRAAGGYGADLALSTHDSVSSSGLTLDYAKISRQVMRQIAEESNRPPRGIMVDPTVTPPLAGYAMFGP